MVKGQTYSEQAFESSSFRHFINTFLAGESGITKGCEIVQGTTTIDIKPGYFIVMGGLLKEEGSSNKIPGEAGYYKLVYEVDLSQANTDTEFNQGNYKFLKGIGSYPSLTQEDLDNSGNIYQFEFCQFRVTESGIQDFKDMRTFLDFDSIYEEVREKITEIEDGSMITEAINELKNELKSQINGLASGSPLVASSVDEMTNTTRVYVNTTDGNWYYYNGNGWVAGGVYQATKDSLTVENIVKLSKLVGGNLIEPEWINGYYLQSGSYSLIEQKGFKTSKPFYLEKGNKLLVQAKGYNTTVEVLGKTNIDGSTNLHCITGTSEYSFYEIEITESGYYRASGKDSLEFPINIISYKNTLYDDFQNQLNKTEKNKVLFNKIMCIGDSITKGYRKAGYVDKDKSYPAFLSKLSGWECINGGEAGFTSSDWYNNWSESYIKPEYDAYIIKLGQNGGLTDTINTDCIGSSYLEYANTHTGNYCKIIEHILETNPKAKIFLVSIQASSTATNTVIEKIAEKYNLPYIDLSLYNEDLDASKYHVSSTGASYDVHFNTIGYIELTNAIYQGILKAINENINEYIDY